MGPPAGAAVHGLFITGRPEGLGPHAIPGAFNQKMWKKNMKSQHVWINHIYVGMLSPNLLGNHGDLLGYSWIISYSEGL